MFFLLTFYTLLLDHPILVRHTHTNKQNKDKHLTNCRTRFPEIIQHLQYKELYNATWVSSQSGMESCPSLTSRAWNPFAAESPRGSWWHVNWMLKRLWRCYRMCLRGVNRMVPWAVVCMGAISGTTYSSGIPRRTLPSSSLVGRERERKRKNLSLAVSLLKLDCTGSNQPKVYQDY